jgi:hypothetical protein
MHIKYVLAKDRANNNTTELKESLNSSPERLVFAYIGPKFRIRLFGLYSFNGSLLRHKAVESEKPILQHGNQTISLDRVGKHGSGRTTTFFNI